MNAITYYSEAIKKVDEGEITIGEYERLIKVLRDVEPVVRCRDCKYWKTAEGINLSKRLKCCTYHIGNKYVRCDEDFCSRGERKDGDGNEVD